MPANCARISTDCDGYERSLQDILEILIINPYRFRAELTWLELPGMQLIAVKESTGRIVRLRAQRRHLMVSFPAERDSILIPGGSKLEFGSLFVHDQDACLPQRTSGATHWGCIAIPIRRFATISNTYQDQLGVHPRAARLLTPERADLERLLTLF